MLEYLHFLPGRLRLKISSLKHERRAAEAAAYVSALPGVRSVVANPATGSLTINFARDEISIVELWERLRAQGYVSGSCPEPAAIGSAFTENPSADRLARAMVTAFVETLARHSAVALVRALL